MHIFEFLKTYDLSAFLIAFAGAVGSVLGSLYLTNRKINAERRFRREELTRSLAESLQNKRLECYPQLWHFVSDYLKPLHNLPYKEFNESSELERLKRLLHDVSEWDSKYSLLLSKEAANVVFYARNNIFKITKLLSGDDVAEIKAEERDKILTFSLQEVELTLKRDIAIFETGEFEARKRFNTYDELEEEWRRRKK